MSHSYTTINISTDLGIQTITLNRPEVRNAFDAAMIAELTMAFEAASADQTLRAVVVRGEGKSFCAGADLNWMRSAADHGEAENLEDARRLARMFQALIRIPCPTLCIAQGAALGGGSGLVAGVDIALVEADCKLGFTEVRLGIIPSVISTVTLRKVSPGHARRFFATGEIFDGRKAKEIGLASEALPKDELESVASSIINQILNVGPRAARASKALIDDALKQPLSEFVEHSAQLIAKMRGTPEAQEGMAAFLEKRAPAWKQQEKSS